MLSALSDVDVLLEDLTVTRSSAACLSSSGHSGWHHGRWQWHEEWCITPTPPKPGPPPVSVPGPPRVSVSIARSSHLASASSVHLARSPRCSWSTNWPCSARTKSKCKRRRSASLSMRAGGRRLDRIFRRSAQRRISRTLAEALAATTVTEQVQQLIGFYRAQYFLCHRLSPT